MDRIVDYLKSEKGKDAMLVIDLAVKVLFVLWLLKNHKIIKK